MGDALQKVTDSDFIPPGTVAGIAVRTVADGIDLAQLLEAAGSPSGLFADLLAALLAIAVPLTIGGFAVCQNYGIAVGHFRNIYRAIQRIRLFHLSGRQLQTALEVGTAACLQLIIVDCIHKGPVASRGGHIHPVAVHRRSLGILIVFLGRKRHQGNVPVGSIIVVLALGGIFQELIHKSDGAGLGGHHTVAGNDTALRADIGGRMASFALSAISALIVPTLTIVTT